MSARPALARLTTLPAALLDPLQPLLALGLRLYAGWPFFASGLTKIQDWSSTLFLFTDEYHVPVIAPGVAAVLATAGELALPPLLWLGLATRLAALGLSLVNIVAVVAYAHVLLAPGFEAAIGQHLLWGVMLLVTLVYGPGRLSLDAWLGSPSTGRSGPG
ncbi:MAG: DoxX family protein [Gammaproteobacteria bacterium]|nr:DoxX family protein [Gammaproteobacteria bacterium]